MLVLSVQDLTRRLGDRLVVPGLSFELYLGQRVGLVGPNGVGKSTLLHLLAGRDTPDRGEVRLHAGAQIGLLEQQPRFAAERTLFAEAQAALEHWRQAQQELESITEALAQAQDPIEHERLAARYDRLNELLRRHDAYRIDHTVQAVLSGLGFTAADLDRPVLSFSGGQQSRILLAKLLLAGPDVLLLDEPSNHLDVQTTEWLENWLVDQHQAMLIVSHDRTFLNRVATHIWEMDGQRLHCYRGNYDSYVRQRDERRAVQQRTWEAQQEYIAKQEEYIRRVHYGQLARQAQSRRNALEKLERVDRPVILTPPQIAFASERRAGDVLVEAEGLAKCFSPDRLLFSELSFQLRRGERLGIMGPNGCGKSTLLRVILGLEPPSAGQVRLGHQVDVGYFDQHLASLADEQEVLRAAWPEGDRDMTELRLRQHLAAFGLTGDLVFQKVGQLSGGERSRLALAKLAAQRVNLLILDEPTNHLDLWACEALEEALRIFDGGVILVSHDRWLLNRVVDWLIVFAGGRTTLIRGNYDTYQRLRAAEAAAPAADKPKPKPKPKGQASTETSASPPRRKRRFPFRKIADLEADIAAAEEEVRQLEQQLASPALYREGSKVKEITAAFEAAKARVAQLYEHWEEAVEWDSRR
jgi:ATP-binding cassette subfamily F protein 3